MFSFQPQPQKRLVADISLKVFVADMSLWLLLFSNIITIYFAVTENWDLSTIIWIYWFQSVIIGFFNYVRILQLKDFSTDGFELDGKYVEPNEKTKQKTASLFLLHFGFFHFVYFIFLAIDFSNFYGDKETFLNIKLVFLTALIFFINHLFSYFYNRSRDNQTPNIGSVMFFPYARIIPMHCVILLGFIFDNALIFFLIIKTISDLIMHIVGHRIFRKME